MLWVFVESLVRVNQRWEGLSAFKIVVLFNAFGRLYYDQNLVSLAFVLYVKHYPWKKIDNLLVP